MTVLNNKQLAILMCRSLKKYAEPTSAYIDLDSDKNQPRQHTVSTNRQRNIGSSGSYHSDLFNSVPV